MRSLTVTPDWVDKDRRPGTLASYDPTSAPCRTTALAARALAAAAGCEDDWIGIATQDIAPGDSMHIHNVTSDYIPTYTLDEGHQFFKEH